MKIRMAVLLAAMAALGSGAQPDGPVFTKDGNVVRPADYHSWVHLGSSLGLQYEKTGSSRPPSFENVYVNPTSWTAFQKTGQWPDGTMFFLEIRASQTQGSLAVGGQFQGDVVASELEVKDSKRFPSGWAWFDLPKGAAEAAPVANQTPCLACHTANGAVEKTFVQFYPAAMDIAKEKKTVNASYLKLIEDKAFEK